MEAGLPPGALRKWAIVVGAAVVRVAVVGVLAGCCAEVAGKQWRGRPAGGSAPQADSAPNPKEALLPPAENPRRLTIRIARWNIDGFHEPAKRLCALQKLSRRCREVFCYFLRYFLRGAQKKVPCDVGRFSAFLRPCGRIPDSGNRVARYRNHEKWSPLF